MKRTKATDLIFKTTSQVDVLQSEKDGDLKQKKKILEQVSQALDETEDIF